MSGPAHRRQRNLRRARRLETRARRATRHDKEPELNISQLPALSSVTCIMMAEGRAVHGLCIVARSEQDAAQLAVRLAQIPDTDVTVEQGLVVQVLAFTHEAFEAAYTIGSDYAAESQSEAPCP